MSTFLNIFSSETTGPIEAKFHMEPPCVGETHVCSNGPGHMIKMATMPIYGKKLKNLVLRTLKADDLETWYAVSGAQVLQIYSIDDIGLTLTYFTARSNLVPYAFVWEKGKTMDFSETIVVYKLKLATDERSDKKFLLTSKLCPWGLSTPLPWAYIHVLNHEKTNV